MLVLTGCSGDEPDDAESSASPSAPQPDPDELDTDALGGVVADDPKDLTWRLPQVPAAWRQLETQPGEAQWQVSDRCALSAFQPAGLGSDASPTQDEVLEEYVDRLSRTLPSPVEIGSREEVMLPVDSNVDGTMSTRVSRADLSGEGGLGGEILAHRSGDFALVLLTVCGDGSFDEVDAAEFQPFLADLAISATY